MIKLALLCITLSVGQSMATTMSFICSADPQTYTFSLAGGPTSGLAYILGHCNSVAVTASTQSIAIAAGGLCTLPDYDTAFTFIVQEDASFQASTDYSASVECKKDLTTVTKSQTVSASATSTSTSKSASIGPASLAMTILSGGTSTTGAKVGDSLNIKFEIVNSAEKALFDFELHKLDANSGANTVNLVTDSCTAQTSLLTFSGSLPTGDVLEVPMTMFLPTGAGAVVVSSSWVTLKAEINVAADGGFTATTCSGGKKRRATEGNTTSPLATGSISQSLFVYPPEMARYFSNLNAGTQVDAVCDASTPMFGALAGLAVALLVCMAVILWMFCRMRTSEDKSVAFTNNAYKA